MIARRLYLHLLAALQRRCDHPGDAVVADALDRDEPRTAVQWCRICGAIGIGNPVPSPGEPPLAWPVKRRPEPRWER